MTDDIAPNIAQTPSQANNVDIPKDSIITPDTASGTTQPFNLTQAQEQTRGRLAQWLIATLAASYFISLLMIAFVLFGFGKQEQQTFAKDVITIVLSTQAGLVGSALGFYFGRGDNTSFS
jgi:hypothetical protein